jgi:hypothetical protein
MQLENQYFAAVLKTHDDQFLSSGFAIFSKEDRYVEFRSDFVPLVRFGKEAKIIETRNGREYHCFAGQVYLSSSALLRIVGVTDSLLDPSELEVPQKIFMDAMVIAQTKYQEPQFSAQIYAISLTEMRFVCEEKFSLGQLLQISSMEPITLENVIITVEKHISFGQTKTGYRCEILSMPDPSRELLTQYLMNCSRIFDGGEEPEIQ